MRGDTQFINAGASLAPTAEIGTWIPDFQFAGGNGDLVKVFSAQLGTYTRIGDMLRASFRLVTTTWTFTTAAGNLRIIGLPYPKFIESIDEFGSCIFSGVTKAGYTNFSVSTTSGNSFLNITASGSAQAISLVAAADMPSATQQTLLGSIYMRVQP